MTLENVFESGSRTRLTTNFSYIKAWDNIALNVYSFIQTHYKNSIKDKYKLNFQNFTRDRSTKRLNSKWEKSQFNKWNMFKSQTRGQTQRILKTEIFDGWANFLVSSVSKSELGK